MKKIILFSLLIYLTKLANAQVYNIHTLNGQTIYTCAGTFVDGGGAGAAPSTYYPHNRTDTITFCPDIPGSQISISMSQFYVHAGGDQFCVYDGITATSSNLIGGTCWDNNLPLYYVTALDTNSTGCLTFIFTSDAANNGPGWEGAITCVVPCQDYTAILVESDPDTTDRGFLDGCPGLSVCMTAGGNYYENDESYHQSDSSSSFEWDFGDYTYGTGRTVCHTYSASGGYDVICTIKDTFNCESVNILHKRVRISTPFYFDGTTASEFDVCAYDTITLMGASMPTKWFGIQQQVSALTYLPDGSGAHYTSPINYTSFEPGAVINTPNDFVGVCATMEHSYLGDLQMKIVCPNGQTVMLKSYPGGGGTFLGHPVDNSVPGVVGVGYQYCWTPSPDYGTMLDEVGNHTTSYVDNIGTTYTNTSWLPPGNYAPEQSFAGLIGCPLNGLWTIDIIDNLAIDDGYIFEWGLYMMPYVYPDSWSFAPQVNNFTWSGNGIFEQSDSTAYVSVPDIPGLQGFNLHAVNDFGCESDTTIYIRIHPAPQIEITGDTSVCERSPAHLNLNTNATSFQWSTGNTYSRNLTVYPNRDQQQYIVRGTLNGCSYADTITVQMNPLPDAIIATPPSTCALCTSFDGTLSTVTGSNTIDYYQWNFGDGDTLSGSRVNHCYTNDSTYIVTLKTITNFGCEDTSSAIIIISLPPSVNLGPDTTLGKEATMILDAGAGNGLTYLWSTNETTQTIDVKLPGTYKVTVTNEYACDSTDEVIVKAAEITTSNVFTPNGDGINDFFEIENILQYPNSKVVIFNRWGKKVFESNDYKNDWDGKGCADGTYFYILTLNTGDVFQNVVTIIGSTQ